jgi:hypothetical protein
LAICFSAFLSSSSDEPPVTKFQAPLTDLIGCITVLPTALAPVVIPLHTA